MPFNPLHSLRLLPLLLCVSLSVFAQGNQPIGTVLAATGAVTARDAAGTVRNLVRKSEIFVHDPSWSVLMDSHKSKWPTAPRSNLIPIPNLPSMNTVLMATLIRQTLP